MKLKLSAHNKPYYLPILIFNGSDLIPDVQEKGRNKSSIDKNTASYN